MKLRHFIKHKFKDSWENLNSSIKARRWSKNYNGGNRVALAPDGYYVVFEDNFNNPLNLKEWRYSQAWGDFHPDNLTQWYDTTGRLSYVSRDCLVLELRNIPKTYVKKDLPEWRQKDHLPEKFTIPTGVGMVSSKQGWQYGWFEAWIKLPKGTPYWPAFWLSGVNSWPPEIDILEAYSKDGDLYAKKGLFGKLKQNRKIQPNIHYGVEKEGTKEMYGAWDVPVADCTDRFVQYACLWEADRIEIYYDGIRVFKCTDPKILEHFNTSDAQQSIIINHGYHKGSNKPADESAMIVKSIRVLQKKSDK